MPGLDTDLRRTWLFGPGADRTAHDAMLASGADALIVDLEDFTPPQLRDKARALLANFVKDCRDRGRLATVRVNALEADGMLDLAAAMRARPDVIAYPMADRPAQMQCAERGHHPLGTSARLAREHYRDLTGLRNGVGRN